MRHVHLPRNVLAIPASAGANRLKARRPARGMTLVELLIVIAIISILMTMAMGAVYVAQETARTDRTSSMISKLHNVIIDRWESYRTRRLSLTGANTPANRLAGIRELMRIEMPDRYEDISFAPTTVTIPALRYAYERRVEAARVKYNAANGTSHTLTQFLNTVLGDPSNENQSAECLYLLISVSMSADDRAQFKDKEYADTSNPPNYMPEYLDAWGTPIRWLRWAPGFVSDVQVHDPVDRHDPFDPYGLQIGLLSESINKNPPPLASPGETAPPEWGYAMLPLIYAAGPDLAHGIHQLLGPPPSPPLIASKNLNPYSRYDDGSGTYVWRGEGQLTASGDVAHFDNIHNHNPAGLR